MSNLFQNNTHFFELINFLVCLPGINKAGCTCIPVNPGYTTDRIQSIFLECDVSWIIADERAGPLLLPGTFEKESFILGMDRESPELASK